jgi:hypothetical protein
MCTYCTVPCAYILCMQALKRHVLKIWDTNGNQNHYFRAGHIITAEMSRNRESAPATCIAFAKQSLPCGCSFSCGQNYLSAVLLCKGHMHARSAGRRMLCSVTSEASVSSCTMHRLTLLYRPQRRKAHRAQEGTLCALVAFRRP